MKLFSVDKILKEFVYNSDYVNMQAFDGPTALFLAAVQGHFACVDLLLKHEADPDITDHMNVTPLHAG